MSMLKTTHPAVKKFDCVGSHHTRVVHLIKSVCHMCLQRKKGGWFHANNFLTVEVGGVGLESLSCN